MARIQPDLGQVADTHGLTEAKVVELHVGTVYPSCMARFTSGFPFLGGLSGALHTPRLETPRTVVPAGSVGIANDQTGIYPVASPGGWRLIGRTPLRLFRPEVLVEVWSAPWRTTGSGASCSSTATASSTSPWLQLAEEIESSHLWFYYPDRMKMERAVDHPHTPRPLYHYPSTSKDGETITGVIRSNVRIELRVSGSNLIVAETYTLRRVRGDDAG